MPTKRMRDVETLEKKKNARLHFRMLVHRVIFNRNWLLDQDNQKLSLNVKKNIAMLVRPKQKVGMLTLAEKALLQAPHSSRSVADRKTLVKLLLGLLCFTRFSPKVVARLVPNIKYMLLERGRTVIRQGDAPAMVFFMLTGEIQVSKKVFDPVHNNYVEKIELIACSGDCIGDVEVYEDCKRLNTYITTMEVELLYLYLDDFERVLLPVMEKQWKEKKAVIKALPYFKHFRGEQIVTAIKMSAVRQFESLETIYAEDKGQLSYVYFVVNGDCIILQCLKMNVIERDKMHLFYLTDISKENKGSMEMEELTISFIKKNMTGGQFLKRKSEYDITLSDDEAEKEEERESRYFAELENVHRKCGLIDPIKLSIHNEEKQEEEEEEEEVEEDLDVYEIGDSSIYTKRNTSESASRILTLNQNVDKENKSNNLQSSSPRHSSIADGRKLSTRASKYTSRFSIERRLSRRQSKIAVTRLENRFINVGSIVAGGIFGIGEEMKHRVIMAQTTVQCLMIPRFWLLQNEQNPGNIWQARRFDLDTTIPSRDYLFKNFLASRKWSKFKNNHIDSLVRLAEGNPTKYQDVPVMLRLEV